MKASEALYESTDLINQVNLKITHPILETHSNAASSSGGLQAASEAGATQPESYFYIHDTQHISSFVSKDASPPCFSSTVPDCAATAT